MARHGVGEYQLLLLRTRSLHLSIHMITCGRSGSQVLPESLSLYLTYSTHYPKLLQSRDWAVFAYIIQLLCLPVLSSMLYLPGLMVSWSPDAPLSPAPHFSHGPAQGQVHSGLYQISPHLAMLSLIPTINLLHHT